MKALRAQHRWWKWPVCSLGAILGLFTLILAPLQHPVAIDESLRHLAYAKLATMGGWGDFLYHGYFAHASSDPWFLFHILLRPIADLSPLLSQQIIVVASIIALSLTFLWYCRSLRLSSKVSTVLLVILLLGNMQFLLRGFLARPALLQSILTVAVLTCVLHKRYNILSILIIISTLLSHLFVVPLLLCCCFSVWYWSLKDKETSINILLVAVSAITVGILFHPHTINYTQYIFTVFTKLPFLMELDIGTEMMSGSGRDGSLLALIAFSVFMFLIVRKKEGIPFETMHRKGITVLLFIVVVMLCAFYKWVRMIDFLWPLAVCLTGVIISLDPHLPKKAASELLPKAVQRTSVYISIFALILFVHVSKLAHETWSHNTTHSQQHVVKAMQQLPTGTRVFNIDWDLFPMLMHARPDLIYARGMDPGLNHVVDNRSGNLFQHIHAAEPSEWFDRALDIYHGSEAVVLWTERHPKLLRFFQSTNRLQPVYPQDTISVWLLQ